MTESAFFQDLAVLTVLAGLVAVVFSRLGWPKAIGYILAGILMNEHTWGGGFLVDPGSVSTLAQLGIVFLMFGMGLNFSRKDLKTIRGVAVPAAVFDVLMMVFFGYVIGLRLLGWDPVPSLFLGVAICDSATTLLAKVLDEMGWGGRPFAKIVLGTSVCEDILCVGAIAVATGCAKGGAMSFGTFAMSLGALLLFFIAVLVFGLILVPRLIRSVTKHGDGETVTLAVLACCFLVSYIAYKFDFSLAMGAFLVGLLASTSDQRQKIDELADPFKSLFSAMFFVSIGLLVNPTALWAHFPTVLLVSAVVIVGKTFNVGLMTLLTGLDVKTVAQTALSLAQIGEFAFMTAILYAQLTGDASSPMFQIAIGASLLTTLLNPVLIRVSDPLGDFIERHLPERLATLQRNYVGWIGKIGGARNSLSFAMARQAAVRLLVYAALALAVAIGLNFVSRFDFSRFSATFEHYDTWIFYGLANVFFVALVPLAIPATRSLGDEVAELIAGEGNARWQVPVKRLVRLVVAAAVSVLFLLEWGAINVTIFPINGVLSWSVVVAFVLLGVIGWRVFSKMGRSATSHLYAALTAEERREGLARTVSYAMSDGGLSNLRLTADSPAIGVTMGAMNIRAKTGVTVIAVQRDGKPHRNVGADWEFRAGDLLVVLGSNEQIAALKDLLGVTA